MKRFRPFCKLKLVSRLDSKSENKIRRLILSYCKIRSNLADKIANLLNKRREFETHKNKGNLGKFIHKYKDQVVNKVTLKLLEKYNHIRKKITEIYYDLAEKIAKKFKNSDCELDEIKNEAIIGIYQALDRFQPKTGKSFSNYVVWFMLERVYDYKANNRLIRLPKRSIWIYNKLRKGLLTPEELHIQLAQKRISQNEFDRTKSMILGKRLKLDTSRFNFEIDRTAWLDISDNKHLDDFESSIDKDHIRYRLNKILQKLPIKERLSIQLQYYNLYTIDQICRVMRASRSSVKKYLRQAKSKIKSTYRLEEILS